MLLLLPFIVFMWLPVHFWMMATMPSSWFKCHRNENFSLKNERNVFSVLIFFRYFLCGSCQSYYNLEREMIIYTTAHIHTHASRNEFMLLYAKYDTFESWNFFLFLFLLFFALVFFFSLFCTQNLFFRFKGFGKQNWYCEMSLMQFHSWSI